MSLRKTFTGALAALALVLTFGAAAFAQQPPQQQGGASQQQGPTRERGPRRGGPRGPGFGIGPAIRELNLTDAQREQARAIFERFEANTKTQREQLRQLREQFKDGTATENSDEQAKALRAQIREAEKAMHTEFLAILTPEQRTKLEQIEKERAQRMEERRREREGAQPPDQQ